VTDADFPAFKRRSPNVSQPMLLEKKKAEARALKTEVLNYRTVSPATSCG
jgi:hypothetical protein